jgi:hypothetical protein
MRTAKETAPRCFLEEELDWRESEWIGERKRQTFDGASPGFPVNLVGFADLHAAFLKESRTRGSR